MSRRRHTSSQATSMPIRQEQRSTDNTDISTSSRQWILWGSMTLLGAAFLYFLPDPTPVFVNHRMLVVHLLAATPLAYCLACPLRIPRSVARWMSIAVVLAVVSFDAALTVLSDLMIPSTWGMSGRWTVRTLLALMVAVPWIISCPLPYKQPSWQGWILAAILITIPSSLYTMHTLQSLVRTAQQIDPMTAPRKLMLVTQQIMEIDDTASIAGENCKKKLLDLLQRVDSLERECQLPLDSARNDAGIDRAVKLMAIDRFSEAWQLLNCGQSDNSSPILLKILCTRGLEDWKSSQELCEIALIDSIEDGPLERSRLYSWWAESFARQGRIKECIDVQRIAIDKCPDNADAFRLELAQRLAESGQVPEALAILREIEHTDRASDTQFQSSIREMRRGIKNNSCTLSR